MACSAVKCWPSVEALPTAMVSTLLSRAEVTGRRCYAMELNPEYVDMAVRRWQEFTGLTAVHAETGEEFGHGKKQKTANRRRG